MNLGKRLKRARLARELTQEELVELVPGSTQAMISALERRDSQTTILLFAFADALRVNPRWLLTGEGESGLAVNAPERGRFSRRWYDKLPPSQRPNHLPDNH
jgi:transcriptional regulator with XRE-family HTH domain